MSGLPEKETKDQTLPVPVGAAETRPSLARSAPNAEFVSQLIAARDRLAPQRTRRTGTPEGAVGAYSRGARIADRRMPQGYRKTVIA